MVARFLEDLFTVDGWRVTVAHDGEAALRLAAERQPAAITLDLDLPGLDGGAVLTRLKANPATTMIPVVVVSGQPGWLTTVDRQQAAAVLTKPAPPWEIRVAIERTQTRPSEHPKEQEREQRTDVRQPGAGGFPHQGEQRAARRGPRG